jgi:anti-anti-sigma factor
MKISREQVGDVTILRPEGAMKAEHQDLFKRLMVELAGAGQVKVALDMSRVDFIDSSCLGILIWSMKNLRQRGGDLKIFGLTPYVHEVFCQDGGAGPVCAGPFSSFERRREGKANIEHRTLNIEHRTKRVEENLFPSYFDVQRSMFALIFTPTRPPPSRGRSKKPDAGHVPGCPSR